MAKIVVQVEFLSRKAEFEIPPLTTALAASNPVDPEACAEKDRAIEFIRRQALNALGPLGEGVKSIMIHEAGGGDWLFRGVIEE